MESPNLTSGSATKRSSRVSNTSSSEMGASKLDVNSEGHGGTTNPSYHHDEDDIPENQTYYADELISVPDMDKVIYASIYTYWVAHMSNVCRFCRIPLVSALCGLSPDRDS